MADTNRTGRVSSIDYASGTYEVTYYDRGQSVTKKINAVSNGEYKMPKVGQVVTVSHQSNGVAQAVTSGTIWNQSNKPAEGYEGLYRKEYGSVAGEAYEKYDENTGAFTQYVNKRCGRNCNGEIYDTAAGPISLIAGGAFQASGSTASIAATGSVGIIAGTTVSMEAGSSFSLEAGADISIVAGDGYKLSVTGETEEKFTGAAKITYEAELNETVTGAATLEFTAGVEITSEGDIHISCGGAEVTISAGGDVTVETGSSVEINAPTINITGDSGDVTIDGISLVNHTHEDGGEGKPKK